MSNEGDVREIVSLQSFINEMESELHLVGVDMEEDGGDLDQFLNDSTDDALLKLPVDPAVPTSAQAKANVQEFINQLEQELGIDHGDYSNILSPVACPLPSSPTPVKTATTVLTGPNTSTTGGRTPTTAITRTPKRVSQSHLHFVQRIESRVREEEEREEAMADVCVTTKYGELREYLTSPAVVRDACSSSSGSGENNKNSSGSSSVYSLQVHSEAKDGVDALFDSLKVKNLDLYYSTPASSPDKLRHSRHSNDRNSCKAGSGVEEEEDAESAGAHGLVGIGRQLNHSINRSLEFSSPTRVSTGVGSPASTATITSLHSSVSTAMANANAAGVGAGGLMRGIAVAEGISGTTNTEVTTHQRVNSNANTIYGKITPDTVKMLGDERINNDYDDWHSGPKMELEGLQRHYSGLYGTLMSTTGNYTIVHGIEIMLRPDVSLMTHILPALQRTAEASKLTCEVCQSSHVLLEQRSPGRASATDMLLSSPRAAGDGEDGDDGPVKNMVYNLEWDCIDIQVCVSRALKHRVLLCQFFKKLSPFIAHPDPNQRLSKEAGYEFKPHTFQFLKILRRMFTLSALSLSCLYSLPVEHLGGSTSAANTPHIITRQQSRGKATPTTTPVKSMGMAADGSGVKVLSMVSESGEVYDVPYMPTPTGAVTVTADNNTPQKAATSAACTPNSNTKNNDTDTHAGPLAALDYHYVSQLEGMFREDMWKYLREAGKVLEESYKQSEADCATLLTAMQPIYKQHEVQLPVPPPRVKLADIPMTSTFKDEESESSSTDESTTAVGHGGDSDSSTPASLPPLDSMTIIAKLLKELWSLQKKRCDVEIKARLTQKNRHLVNASYSFTKYKGLLISTLASGPGRAKAAKSSLNTGFVTAYMFTKVTDFPKVSVKTTSSGESEIAGSGPEGSSSAAAIPPAAPKLRLGATLGSWLNSAAAYVAPLPPPQAQSQTRTQTPEHSSGSNDGVDIEIDMSSGQTHSSSAATKRQPVFSLSSPPIVMFWCSCLVTSTPGTIYITVDHLYVQYGFAFLHQSKEVYPLVSIDNCQEDPTANVPTLKISLGGKRHQLSITPIGVECSVLRTVLYDILNYNTHHESKTRNKK